MGNTEFQKRLKELRIRKGLSQEELANKSNLSIRTIQRIEKNESNPHGDTVKRLLEILQSMPDLDDINISKSHKESPFDLFIKFFINDYRTSLFLYLFSIGGIFMSALLNVYFLIILTFLVSFLCLFIIVISIIYQFRKKRILKGIINLSVVILSNLLIIGMFTVSKEIKTKTETTTKDNVTRRIEKNIITDKSDTTITIKSLPKH